MGLSYFTDMCWTDIRSINVRCVQLKKYKVRTQLFAVNNQPVGNVNIALQYWYVHTTRIFIPAICIKTIQQCSRYLFSYFAASLNAPLSLRPALIRYNTLFISRFEDINFLHDVITLQIFYGDAIRKPLQT